MIRNTFSSILENNGWLLFLLFCMVFWLFGFANDEFITTDALFEQYVEDQRQEKYDDYDELAAEFEDDIDDFEDEEEYWTDHLWDMGFLVVFNLIRFSIVAGFLFAGLSIASSTEIRFRAIFKVVLVAKFVFIIPAVIKLVWFYFFDTDYTFEDVRDFSPFSALAFIETENLSSWLALPLQEVDLFEFAYVYLLILGIAIMYKVDLSEIMNPVLGAYITMTILSIALRIYLTSLF